MTAEVYRQAARIIGDRGWGQGMDRAPRVCAMDAIALADGLPKWRDEYTAADFAREDALIKPLEDRVGRLVVAWNDEPDRTEAEVRQTLFDLADELERGE